MCWSKTISPNQIKQVYQVWGKYTHLHTVLQTQASCWKWTQNTSTCWTWRRGCTVINTQRHVHIKCKKGCWPLKTTLQPVSCKGRKLGFNAQSTVMVVSGPIQALDFNLSSVQGHLRATKTLSQANAYLKTFLICKPFVKSNQQNQSPHKFKIKHIHAIKQKFPNS